MKDQAGSSAGEDNPRRKTTKLPPVDEEQPDLASTAHGRLFQRIRARFTMGSRGRYHLGAEIARGGQGAIVEVWDNELDRALAMKLVHPDTRPTPDEDSRSAASRRLARFLDEARITGQLDHPGVVPVHELGIDEEGRAFFTMKLVRGRDLGAVFADARSGTGNWNRTRVVGVLLKVCEAMAFAHEKGVIHRDLKPSNIMVGDFGEAYVMDWGLARVLDEIPNSLSSNEEVMGTPVYMPPEQARGSRDVMGPASDVYSVGAMLYQLLTHCVPHVGQGESPSSLEVVMRVMMETPTPVLELAPDAPPELVAICEKAMARDPADRYESMLDLARDLRAHLENHVVRAYESGVVAELKKRIARNRGVFAMGLVAIAVLVVGLVVSLRLRAQAERQRNDVFRLAAIQEYNDLVDEARTLWPATPDRIAAYEDWLARARRLVAGLEGDDDTVGHYQQVARLAALAKVPPNDAWDDLASHHPRYDELVAIEGELAALRAAQAVRSGARALGPYELSASRAGLGWYAQNELAWLMVNPERTRFGREREALALARAALADAPDSVKAQVRDTLAWALLWNGLDEEAVAASEEAVREAPSGQRDAFVESLAEIRAAVERIGAPGAPARIAELEAARDDLRRAVALRFPDERTSWWYAQLTELVAELEAFSDPETGCIEGASERWGPGVERRLAFARSVADLTLDSADAKRRWSEAVASIADPSLCPAYGGLEIVPQLGLLPIGRDPASGLWEFWHVQSGDEPVRGADGRLVVEAGTGIVLVLLPGGTSSIRFVEGGVEHRSDPVELSPYFLSKYELTQGQWQRIALSRPATWASGMVYGKHTVDDRHPIETVRWMECDDVLRRYDLAFPTEAQWDFAVRGGTTSEYFLGDLTTDAERRELSRYANLADAAAASRPWEAVARGIEIGLDDGYLSSAPVDAFLPNPYGLHGMLGNVREWCRDWNDEYYYEPRPGDGEREVLNRVNRVTRGGCMATGVAEAGASARWKEEPATATYYLGVRPSRALRPAAGTE